MSGVIRFFYRFCRCALLIVLLVIAFLQYNPIKTKTLLPDSNPSNSYQESLRRIKLMQLSDPLNVNRLGKQILKDHGQQTDNVIVFFHGFTNSPRQFDMLSEQLYKKGFNVYIPRIPHHGLETTMESELNQLTAEELRILIDESIDIAHGLGQNIYVVGLSMGGVMSGWAAQFRSDVKKAVIIAPCFGTYKLPNRFLKHSINLLHLYPDKFIWWDRELKKDLYRPLTAYYGFSSRALGEIRRLGWMVQQSSKKLAPKAEKIVMVTNENDDVVTQQGINAVYRAWQDLVPEKMSLYTFKKDKQLSHDLIDPLQANQNISLVYPVLVELIDAP